MDSTQTTGGDDMTDMNQHTQSMQSTQAPAAEQGRGGRRHFLGKGVKAAPFFITLASQPALGDTCFTPSRALSKNTSLSQQGKDGECTGAQSAGNYAAQQTTSNGNAYSWPASVPPTTPLHPTFYMGSIEGLTKFTKFENLQVVSKTFGEALQVNGSAQVHFHLIGAYLNAMGGNGAVIPPHVMTPAGLLAIWKEFATKGYYEPTAGVQWYGADIVFYLKDNGMVG